MFSILLVFFTSVVGYSCLTLSLNNWYRNSEPFSYLHLMSILGVWLCSKQIKEKICLAFCWWSLWVLLDSILASRLCVSFLPPGYEASWTVLLSDCPVVRLSCWPMLHRLHPGPVTATNWLLLSTWLSLMSLQWLVISCTCGAVTVKMDPPKWFPTPECILLQNMDSLWRIWTTCHRWKK